MTYSSIRRILGACALAILATAASAQTTEGGQPLSTLILQIEANGARTVVAADGHRRFREVVSCEGRSRICREDVIDANTGAVRASETTVVLRLPPAGGLPASAIAASVEAMNLGTINDFEFDDRLWDIEVRRGIGSTAELEIDPMTGAVVRCTGRACP